jgi:hypothetical protein
MFGFGRGGLAEERPSHLDPVRQLAAPLPDQAGELLPLRPRGKKRPHRQQICRHHPPDNPKIVGAEPEADPAPSGVQLKKISPRVSGCEAERNPSPKTQWIKQLNLSIDGLSPTGAPLTVQKILASTDQR